VHHEYGRLTVATAGLLLLLLVLEVFVLVKQNYGFVFALVRKRSRSQYLNYLLTYMWLCVLYRQECSDERVYIAHQDEPGTCNHV